MAARTLQPGAACRGAGPDTLAIVTKKKHSDPLHAYKEAGKASAEAALAAAAESAGAGQQSTTAEQAEAIEEVVTAAVAGVDVTMDSDGQTELPLVPEVAAFFDIDNTIMRGASIFFLAKGAYSRDFLTLGDLVGFGVDQLKFATGGDEDLDAMAEATEAGLSFVKGRTVEEIVELGEEIYDTSMSSKMWPGTIALAQQHLAAGERVWLVSATPVEIARVIAERLGFTGAMGTVSEVRDGRYTGHLVGHPLHGVAKAEAVRALAAREGLDLTRCYASSDSSNDLPMLTAVGNPVAVNPDEQLKQAARDNRWPIYDFRSRRQWRRYKLPGLIGGAALAGVAVGAVGGYLARRPH